MFCNRNIVQRATLIGDSTKLHFCKISYKRKREKAPKAVLPFCGNMNLYRGYNSPQELSVFQQEIEIRICKKTQAIFIHCILFHLNSCRHVGGNLFCALIIASVGITKHSSGLDMNLCESNLREFSADLSRTSKEVGRNISSHFNLPRIPKKMWIFEIFAIQ